MISVVRRKLHTNKGHVSKITNTHHFILTNNAIINPMLKLISTCISIFNKNSTIDSSRCMDLIPINLRGEDNKKKINILAHW